MWQGSFLMISWLVCVVKLLSSALPALRFHSPLSCFNHMTIQALDREERTRGNLKSSRASWSLEVFFFGGWCKRTQLVHSVDSEAVSIFSAFFLPPSCHFYLPLSFSTFLWPSSAALLHTSLRVPLRSSCDTSPSARRENLHTPLREYTYTATCYRKGWL